MKNENNSVFGGLFWSFLERMSAQIVSTIVTIILARLLSPEHYGLISIVTVFITLCNIFVSSGFGSALVQKKEADDDDFNTAFTISFVISLILYIVIFVLAPLISKFYEMPELIVVMRVMGLRLILASLNTIQQSSIQRKMQFKKFFIVTLIGTVISAIIGITMACFDFGVWALVAQYLTNTVVGTIILLIIDEWKPKFKYYKEKAKKIFSFGWKVLVTNLVFTLEGDIRSLIIGKVFGPKDLAFYDQGKKYPSLLVTNLNTAINKVMLPSYSKNQDNKEKIKLMLRKSVRIGLYILIPILVGFALVSENFVRIFLTEKWLFCVPYIQIFCLSYLTRPLETSCHQAILAIGRSDIVLYLMIIIHSFSLVSVLIAAFVLKSVLWIAIGTLFVSLISIVCFMVTVNICINYTIKEQLSDLFPNLVLGIFMVIVVYPLRLINISPIHMLIIQIISGMIIYILVSHLFNNSSYNFCKRLIVKKLKKC